MSKIASCTVLRWHKYVADVSSEAFAQLSQYEWLTISQYLLLKMFNSTQVDYKDY